MAEKWDKQLMDFLKRTGEDLKRTGEEFKVEAQRLLDEVRDPDTQAKLKETLKDLRVWAATTTKDAAEKIETAMRRVEGAVESAWEVGKQDEAPKARSAASTRAAPTQSAPAAEPKPARKTTKTLGKKKAAAKSAASKSPASKTARKAAPKSIGRKKSAP